MLPTLLNKLSLTHVSFGTCVYVFRSRLFRVVLKMEETDNSNIGLISCVHFVKRGVAKANPEKV